MKRVSAFSTENRLFRVLISNMNVSHLDEEKDLEIII